MGDRRLGLVEQANLYLKNYAHATIGQAALHTLKIEPMLRDLSEW
ncbi:hypothetical protein [Nodosilinea sp. E11]|nr:hypothetical protein [Nodosilinea sp. E11]WOD40089.1 hypothetical protein RRF56_04715 [Nodosilinea sp. E11]